MKLSKAARLSGLAITAGAALTIGAPMGGCTLNLTGLTSVCDDVEVLVGPRILCLGETFNVNWARVDPPEEAVRTTTTWSSSRGPVFQAPDNPDGPLVATITGTDPDGPRAFGGTGIATRDTELNLVVARDYTSRDGTAICNFGPFPITVLTPLSEGGFTVDEPLTFTFDCDADSFGRFSARREEIASRSIQIQSVANLSSFDLILSVDRDFGGGDRRVEEFPIAARSQNTAIDGEFFGTWTIRFQEPLPPGEDGCGSSTGGGTPGDVSGGSGDTVTVPPNPLEIELLVSLGCAPPDDP
jgi:hypothetical protein